MDPCLRLALLDPSLDLESFVELRRLSAVNRRHRYAELIAADPPADSREARWTSQTTLYSCVPEEADNVLRSLAGIEAYPGLRKLHFTESDVEDLTPLTGLPSLEQVWLGVTAAADLSPLLLCERLKRVHIDGVATACEVFDRLAARGVQVDNLVPDPETAKAPFADPNLKLAVLETLRDSLDLPTVHFFDGNAVDRGNLARLLATELSQEHYDSIEEIVWLEGDEIPGMVWKYWDGECDTFEISSLDGVEVLRNLRKLTTSLEQIPADQIAALRARGVSVVELFD
jgi:hypothetical protein